MGPGPAGARPRWSGATAGPNTAPIGSAANIAPPVKEGARGGTLGSPALGEQCSGEVAGVERAQVLDALTHPDQLHRDAELVGDRKDDPALRRAVQLGEDDAGHVHRL